MASERCRRWGQSFSVILKAEEAPQFEESEEHEELKELTVPFLGSLTNISLLRSFKTHVATDIWNGDVRF